MRENTRSSQLQAINIFQLSIPIQPITNDCVVPFLHCTPVEIPHSPPPPLRHNYSCPKHSSLTAIHHWPSSISFNNFNHLIQFTLTLSSSTPISDVTKLQCPQVHLHQSLLITLWWSTTSLLISIIYLYQLTLSSIMDVIHLCHPTLSLLIIAVTLIIGSIHFCQLALS